MIIFKTNLTDSTPWGLAGRAYLRELATAHPYRLGPIGISEAWEEELLGKEAAHAMHGQTTMPHLMPRAVFCHGDVLAVTGVGTEDMRPPPGGVSVAITRWDRAKLPRALARSLRRFTEVWVPSARMLAALETAGVESVQQVNIPSARYTPAEPARRRKLLVLHAHPLRKAETQGVLDHFVQTLEPDCGIELLVVGDGCVPITIEDAPEFVPTVRYVSHEPDTPHWVSLLRQARVLITTENDPEADYLGRLAARLECHSIQMPLEALYERLFIAIERFCLPHDCPPCATRDLLASGDPVGALARVQGRESRREVFELPLTIVVPHRDRGTAWVAATLNQIAPDLQSGDRVVVADYGSVPSVLASAGLLTRTTAQSLCSPLNLVVADVPCAPDAPWSRARCCNWGATIDPIDKKGVLLFLDCDVLLQRGTLQRLRLFVEGAGSEGILPHDIVTFSVADGDPALPTPSNEITFDPTQKTRPATGCMMVRAEKFHEARGFDETFLGYGAEDTQLIYRLVHDFGATWWKDTGTVACHQPHPPDRNKGGPLEKQNEAWALARMRGGENSEVNPAGYGSVVFDEPEGEE